MAEQNENKEKKGIAAWWAGLAKGAKIGISAGAAVLVAGAVVGTVFGVKSYSGSGDTIKSITIEKNMCQFVENEKTEATVALTTDPSNASLEKADIKFEGNNDNYYDISLLDKNKTINVKCKSFAERCDCTITVKITINGKEFSPVFYTKNQE